MVLTILLIMLFVFGVVALAFVGYVISMYNTLVSMKRRVDQSWEGIGILEKQRNDELTKLIDVAKKAMDHEEDVLTALTEAREQAEQAGSPKEHAEADEMVRNAMATFNARVEAYPELKSQGNLAQVSNRISDIEEQISDRREHYNESATRYNTRIQQFPYVLLAGQFGFTEAELFQASEEDKQDVDVGAAFA